MQTSKIEVKSSGAGMEEALDATESFGQSLGLGERNARWLRLLAEETLGMVRAIVGDFRAGFWLECASGQNCRIHLTVDTAMDYGKKLRLIETSSSQRNAASAGIMGRIRDIVEDCCYAVACGGDLPAAHAHGMMGMGGMMGTVPVWSLQQYRDDVQEASASDDPIAQEELEELERSIVANIADDVQVGIVGNQVEMVIRKDFAAQG